MVEQRIESTSSLSIRSVTKTSGRSSRASKYTKAIDVDVAEETIAPVIDYETDIEDEPEKELNEYDSAATGRKLYQDACKLYGVIPVTYFFRYMEQEVFDISHRQLGPSATRAMAVALTVNTKILRLLMSDNGIGADGAIALSEMLVENNYLQELDIAQNEIEKTGCDSLFSMLLENTTIQKLVLDQCKLNNECISGMIVPLAQAHKLEELVLSGNKFTNGDLLARTLAENASLKVVDLSWNTFRGRDGFQLLKGLKESVCLTSVDVSHCGLDDTCATILRSYLSENTVIEEFKASCNNFRLVSAVALGDGLRESKSLKKIQLCRNPFLTEGCLAIGKGLAGNTDSTLELLDLDDIVTGKEFDELNLKELFPKLTIISANSWMEKKSRKPRKDPIQLLKDYMEAQGLRLVDFFNKLDTDGSMSLSRAEFKDGILMAGIPMTESEIEGK